MTQRQLAEAEIARLNHQNQTILNSTGEGIYGLDRQGKIIFINPAAAKMLEDQTEELLGKSVDNILHHSAVDGKPDFWQCPIYQSLQNGTTHRVTNEIFWRRDGSSFPVDYVSPPIQEKGETVGAAIAFQDITERSAIERIKDENCKFRNTRPKSFWR